MYSHYMFNNGRLKVMLFRVYLTPFKFRKNIPKILLFDSNSYSCSSRKMERQQNGFSLSNFDVIGFDLDHTLCRYKLRPLFELIYENMASFLVERRGYSKDLYKSYESGEDFVQKGIVFDKLNGNFLKVSSDFLILKATHGTTPMTDEQIVKFYGENHTWDQLLELPEGLCRADAQQKPYYVFRDYFVLPVILICARLVDIVDKEYGSWLPHYNIWQDVYDGLIYMYRRDHFKDDVKGFFSNLKKNPENYLVPCSRAFLQWLLELKRDKKLFLLTSSNIDYADFIGRFCLGDDWKEYFDIGFMFARKPSFFTSQRPFLTLNGMEEGEIISCDSLELKGVYSQGNWKDLKTFFSNVTGKQKPSILYVGDSIIEDVFSPSNYGRCKTIAIVEEMKVGKYSEESNCLESKFWGSFFDYPSKESNNGFSKTLWYEIISSHSILAIPDLEALSSLSLKCLVPFEKDLEFAFYPNKPSNL
ncbi:5'-nucleotidase domain-containing protein 1 [Centruroides vittatus]|uniref:5'-nucleotidase domain-containing protein 1 n=1 Tax=Centruroides vittatus TaxID=120091 RepID=UPI003510B16F